jgi:hypothetical protein
MSLQRAVFAAFFAASTLTISAQQAVDPEKLAVVSHPRAAPSVELGSDYVEVAVESDNGNYTMGTRQGDPANPNDDNARLMFGHPAPATGATTLLVDGNPYWNYGNVTPIGTLVSPPQTAGGVNTMVCEANGIRMTQRLQLAQSSSTGREDTLRVEIILENVDSIPHDAGLRIMWDTQLGDNDGAPFRVPGIGEVTQEREALGDEVPPFYQVFDSLADPQIIAQGTLSGGDAVRPDRVVWCQWSRVNDTPWDFTVDPMQNISDSAVATYWNPTTLQPGQSRRIVTYYGLGAIDMDMRCPVAVGLTGPKEIPCENMTPQGGEFTLVAYLANVLGCPEEEPIFENLTEVYAQILPGPVTIAPFEDDTKMVDELAVGASALLSWQLIAPPTPGTYTIEIEVGCAERPPKIVQYTITVPDCGLMLCDLTGQWTNVQIHRARNGAPKAIYGRFLAINNCDQSFRNLTLTIYLTDDVVAFRAGLRPPIVAIRQRVGSLAAHSSRLVHGKVNLPRGTVLTGRYLIGFIDSDNKVSEGNESNNWVEYGPLP